MFRRTSVFVAISVLLTVIRGASAWGVEQEFDLSNAGKGRARDALAAKVLEGRPDATPVLASEQYFFDAYKLKRPVGRRKLAMSDISNKEIVFLAIFDALMGVAAKDVKETSEQLQKSWESAERSLIERLAKEDKDGESVIDDEQAVVLRHFFAQWHTDVTDADVDRYRDALIQAAYGLAEATLGIKKLQAEKAKSSEGTPSGSRSSSVSQGTGSAGYYPFHERMLNHIYHHHDRQMNRVERIRARR